MLFVFVLRYDLVFVIALVEYGRFYLFIYFEGLKGRLEISHTSIASAF